MHRSLLSIGLIWMFFLGSGGKVLGAQAMPELEDPENMRMLDEFQGTRQEFERTKRVVVAAKLRERGWELFQHGQYSQALALYDRALQICPDDCVRLDRATCLGHLGRTTEALFIMDGLIKKSPTEESNILPKIELLGRLSRKQEALRLCDVLLSASLSDRALVAKSKILSQMSRPDEAKVSARRAYYITVQQGGSRREAEECLKSLREPIPDIIVPVTCKNAEVLTMIDRIITLEPQDFPNQLTPMFHPNFRAYSTGSDGGKEWYAVDYKQLFGSVSYRYDHRRDDCHPRLSLLINFADASITADEVKQTYSAKTVQGFGSEQCTLELPGEAGHGPRTLTFSFTEQGSKPLCAVFIAWTDPKYVSVPPDPPPPKRATEREEINQAKAELAKCDYKLACRLLWRAWLDREPNDSPRVAYATMLEKRKLLATVYRRLKRSDIAQYIETAPFQHISRDIVSNYSGSLNALPTIEEYREHRWTVSGCASDPDRGYYIVKFTRYPTIMIMPPSAMFTKLWHSVGRVEAGRHVPITPLTREDLDALQFKISSLPRDKHICRFSYVRHLEDVRSTRLMFLPQLCIFAPTYLWAPV
jgi:tetratricopeptide (TPR) repeat protein